MKNIYIIYVILFGAFIGISLPLPLLGPLLLSEASPFALAENHRYLFLSLALAAFPLGNLIGAPLMGFFSDRLGKKKMLVGGLIGGCFFYLLTGLSIAQGNILLLLVARCLCGLCEGNSAIAQSYIAKSASAKEKPRLFGAMIAVISVGYVAGPLVGGFLSNANFIPFASNSLPFYFVAGIIGLTVILVACTFESDSASDPSIQAGFVDGMKDILKETIFTRLLFLALFLAMGRALFIDFLSSFLTIRFGVASDQTTWLWMLIAAVWGISALFCDFASKKISYNVKIIASCSVASFTIIILSLSQTMTSVAVLSCIMALSLALAGAINAVLVSDAAPKRHLGLAMGLLSSTYLGGEVTACLSGGTLLSFSTTTPFLVSGGLLLLVALGFIVASAKSGLDECSRAKSP